MCNTFYMLKIHGDVKKNTQKNISILKKKIVAYKVDPIANYARAGANPPYIFHRQVEVWSIVFSYFSEFSFMPSIYSKSLPGSDNFSFWDRKSHTGT